MILNYASSPSSSASLIELKKHKLSSFHLMHWMSTNFEYSNLCWCIVWNYPFSIDAVLVLFSYPLSPSLSLGVVGAGNAHGVAGVERRSRLECTKGWESRQRVAKVTLYDFNTLSPPLLVLVQHIVLQYYHASWEILGPPINQTTTSEALLTDLPFSCYFCTVLQYNTVGPTKNQAMTRGQVIKLHTFVTVGPCANLAPNKKGQCASETNHHISLLSQASLHHWFPQCI